MENQPMDQWIPFLRQLADVACESGDAKIVCADYARLGTPARLRILAWSSEAVYADIEKYRLDYDEIEKAFGQPWDDEQQRICSQVLAPFASSLVELVQLEDEIEDRAVIAFDVLVQAWNSFEKETVGSVLNKVNSSTAK